jgi:hypothetical protein
MMALGPSQVFWITAVFLKDERRYFLLRKKQGTHNPSANRPGAPDGHRIWYEPYFRPGPPGDRHAGHVSQPADGGLANFLCEHETVDGSQIDTILGRTEKPIETDDTAHWNDRGEKPGLDTEELPVFAGAFVQMIDHSQD